MYKILANTLFIGKKLVFVPECHSTNTLALELSQKEDLPEGTVIITSHQTQGRGQQGNTWIAEKSKNLTFSLVVKPFFLAIKDQFYLNMAVSLGLSDFASKILTQQVSVKWPNDIMVDDFKICGILIENQIQGTAFTNSVIGIGLNVNQKGFYSPNASSLSMLSNHEFDLQEVLEQVAVSLEKWYLVLRQNGIDRIKQAYSASLYGINETRRFKTRDDQFEGIIEGVDNAGRLMIKTKIGSRHFNTKEVQFVYDAT